LLRQSFTSGAAGGDATIRNIPLSRALTLSQLSGRLSFHRTAGK